MLTTSSLSAAKAAFSNTLKQNPFWIAQGAKTFSSSMREGRGIVGSSWATTKSYFASNWLALAMPNSVPGFWALSAIQAVPMLSDTAMTLVRSRADLIRQAGVPFSHRFEHSDFSYRAQQIGIASISGGQSLIGAEAGMFAARYGRR